jgi:hypothetical protein
MALRHRAGPAVDGIIDTAVAASGTLFCIQDTPGTLFSLGEQRMDALAWIRGENDLSTTRLFAEDRRAKVALRFRTPPDTRGSARSCDITSLFRFEIDRAFAPPTGVWQRRRNFVLLRRTTASRVPVHDR